MGDTHLTALVFMYPRGEFKKNLTSNRAKAASNVEGNGHEGWAFCLSTCGGWCMLWAGSWELLHISPCPALQSLGSVAQAAWQHMKVTTDECEVSCIRRNNFKLLAHVAGCEINCSGEKIQTTWHHYGYFIENIYSLQSPGSKEKRDFLSSPNDQWIPWSIGTDSVC